LRTLGQKTVRLYARPLASFTAWASWRLDQVDSVAQYYISPGNPCDRCTCRTFGRTFVEPPLGLSLPNCPRSDAESLSFVRCSTGELPPKLPPEAVLGGQCRGWRAPNDPTGRPTFFSHSASARCAGQAPCESPAWRGDPGPAPPVHTAMPFRFDEIPTVPQNECPGGPPTHGPRRRRGSPIASGRVRARSSAPDSPGPSSGSRDPSATLLISIQGWARRSGTSHPARGLACSWST